MLLTLLTWLVLVVALRVALAGNPALQLLRDTPLPVQREASAFLSQRAQAAAEGNDGDEGEDEEAEEGEAQNFLRRFTRVSLLLFLVFLVEMALTLYFLYADPWFPVPWFLWVKNMLMLYVAFALYRENRSKALFDAIRELPAWAPRWERISYLATALCCVGLLLRAINIL